MKISGIQRAPATDRPRDVQSARQALPRATTQPPEASQPTVEERMAKTAKNVGARIAAAVDAGSLTTRQAQALSEVQKDFENKLGRLAQAMHQDGVSRHQLNDGLSKVYGSLRDKLGAILAAGKASPFDPSHGTTPLDRGGLAVDVTV